MSLLEDLTDDANFPSGRKHTCAVCVLLSTLTEKESKVLVDRFENKRISHSSLSIVLKKNGIMISDSVVGRHRRGVCQSGVRK